MAGTTDGRTCKGKLDAVAGVVSPHGRSSVKVHTLGRVVVVHGPRLAAVGDPRFEICGIDDEGPAPALSGIGKLASQD